MLIEKLLVEILKTTKKYAILKNIILESHWKKIQIKTINSNFTIY